MPVLTKHVLTRYLGSDCPKQLRLLLSPPSGDTAAEHTAQGMPPEQPPRPGLQSIAAAGDEWAAAKLAELDGVLGSSILLGNRQKPKPDISGIAFATTALTPGALATAANRTFLVEHQFVPSDEFEKLWECLPLKAGHGFRLGSLRPDLIEVLAPGAHQFVAQPDGSVVPVVAGDGRRQLRVIDIKLTSQPGPGYFAEVVYYSVALSCWLVDAGLDGQYAVSAEPAIWPGSHDASPLAELLVEARATSVPVAVADAMTALNSELVTAPFEVFVSRLRHFFGSELPGVLDEPWDQLPYHVTPRCKGCDYLGQYWGPNNPGDPGHCIPTAKSTDHLSRIPFVSRGATNLLRDAGNGTVADVAGLPPEDPAFDQHHSLRGQRTIVSARAGALAPDADGGLVPRSGTSAVLPMGADLRVYLSADFDASSAITLAFALKGWWWQPRPRPGQPAFTPQPAKRWATTTHVVTTKSLKAEERELLAFLDSIDRMLREVKQVDDARGGDPSRVQFFVWDDLTYAHLCRVVGRHLKAVLDSPNGLRRIAWLFPPEEVMQNSRLVSTPAISIVGQAVKGLVALPVAHHYSLLGTARAYNDGKQEPPFNEFKVHPLFEDPLSDQIPSERAHAIWSKAGGSFPHADQQTALTRALNVRLNALESIASRLMQDLKGNLRREAPPLTHIAPPESVAKLTADELLILTFSRLNAAVDAQNNAQIRAMPPHEREAKFESARLTRRLTGQERQDALAALGHPDLPREQVYVIREGSKQAKIAEGDFTVALVPEGRVEILDWKVSKLAGPKAPLFGDQKWMALRDVLGVTVVKYDRDLMLCVVCPSDWPPARTARDLIESEQLLSFDAHVSLEKVAKDFLDKKLTDTLKAIGKTPKAVASQAAAVAALGGAPNPRSTKRVPVEDVLWDAAAMSDEFVDRQHEVARASLCEAGRDLNTSQWKAWQRAMTHRLTLVWGPPGTGKSRTLANVVLGAVTAAAYENRGLRILVTAQTFSAVENVLKPIAETMQALAPGTPVWYLHGEGRPKVDWATCGTPGSPGSPTAASVQPLISRLGGPGITVVGAPSQQAHKFAALCGRPTAPVFDLIVCDEASQMDVANAVLPLAMLAEDGAVVVGGDFLQLAPIRQVDPPEGTEHLVGSLYDYLAKHHGVQSQNLTVNYRSNEEIVAVARAAKYPAGLVPHSPSLRLDLLSPPRDDAAPDGWPSELVWSPGLYDLLDPARPVTCLVYPDVLSGQSNDFEAQTVAGLAWLLSSNLADQLSGELDENDVPKPRSSTPYEDEWLLRKGVGVVTPHRAQVSLIGGLLRTVLPVAPPDAVRGSVDSVERYQGQQRDVIIGSYAVGDPDIVADEDEFLQSLNRFNVLSSRARAKLIVLVSESVIQHLPFEVEHLRSSALLKSFVETLCSQRRPLSLDWADPRDRTVRTVAGSMRWTV
jgi:DNA replication ATP-dependent helicase Dna2